MRVINLVLPSIMVFTKNHTAEASTLARSAPIVGLAKQLLWLRTSEKYADPRLCRKEDNDAKAPAESQDDEIPLFEDEDSAAWASFSLNVAIARKSISSVQVRTLKKFTPRRYHWFGSRDIFQEQETK